MKLVNQIRRIPLDVATSILVSLLLALINIRHDLISSPDSATCKAWAELLIDCDFNLEEYYRNNSFVSPPIFYTAPVVMIGALKLIFGDSWEKLFFAINIFLAIGTIEVFRRSGRLLNIDSRAVSMVLLLFLFSADFIIWPHYLLSDTLFSFMVTLSVHTAIRSAINKSGYIPPIFLCALLTLSRPSSPPVVGAIGLFLVISAFRPFGAGIKRTILLLLSCILFFAAFYGAFMEAELITPSGSEALLFIGSRIKDGVVIVDRPDTFLEMSFIPNSLEVSRLFILRFIMFFSPYGRGYSTSHILANWVTLCPFVSSIIAWTRLPLEAEENLRRGGSLILTSIVFIAIFHSATQIDFDWRYRYPTISLMFLFVAITIDCGIKTLGQYRTEKSYV